MNLTNQQYRLPHRPTGLPGHDTWQLTEEGLPDPAEGQIAVQVLYTSLDPAMRTWLNEGESYVPPVGVGEVKRALGIGRVIASRAPQFKEDDLVTGLVGIQRYAVVPAKGMVPLTDHIEPLTIHLNALGIEKCRVVTDEYGFDAAIDYKAGHVAPSLRQHCPDGIDVYFDNVGGEILEAALRNLAPRARIVICGAVSQYNDAAITGPRNYMNLLVKRARMEGFVVFDYAKQYAEAAGELGAWISAGKLKSREHVVEGFETFPEALLMLYSGENTAKLVLKIAGAEA